MRQSSYQLTPTTHPSPLLPPPNSLTSQPTHSQNPMSLLLRPQSPAPALVAPQTLELERHPRQAQQRILMSSSERTHDAFRRQDHAFDTIRTYAHFSKRVPVRDYEALRPWLDRVRPPRTNVLWPGEAALLARDVRHHLRAKYIPITRASIPTIESTRNALLNYIPPARVGPLPRRQA